MSVRSKKPQIVLRDGKPAAVILDLNTYEDLLERAEEAEDLRILRRLRKKPTSFRKLSEIIGDRRRV